MLAVAAVVEGVEEELTGTSNSMDGQCSTRQFGKNLEFDNWKAVLDTVLEAVLDIVHGCCTHEKSLGLEENIVVTSTQNHRIIHLFSIIKILNKFKIFQDRIRKFSNNIDLRKLDFLSQEKISECSRFVNKDILRS